MASPDTDPAIIFIDDALIVAHKPCGLPSVPARAAHLRDCMSSRVQALAPDALVVHRLDMATSGLIAFARGKAAQRQLSLAFAERQVRKRYVAVVEGLLQDSGEIDLPLVADWPNRPRQMVDQARGKPSLTRYRALAYDRITGTTRVALEPVTGRSHQLRVHLAALGHPILGDMLYGPPDAATQSQRLLLHAERLELPHPATREWHAFESAPVF